MTDRASGHGALLVVSTPIGNLRDLTLRAIDTMGEVTAIAAEDTRRARALLSHLGVTAKQVIHLDAHANNSTLNAIVTRVAQGEQIAVLTDAGTPAVSDPGTALVQRCHERELRVIPIPGPSAVTAAVAASGLVDQGFLFLGFLPRKGEKRRRALDRIQRTPEAVVLFEAANRLSALVSDLGPRIPDRQICVARELTKKFEELAIRPASEWAGLETEGSLSLKGELTLVIGSDTSADRPVKLPEAKVVRLLEAVVAGGMPTKLASETLAPLTGYTKRELYQLANQTKRPSGSDSDSSIGE